MFLRKGIHFIVMGIKQAISVHTVQENPENIKKNKENHGKENNKKIAEDTDNDVQPQKILHAVFTGVRQMNYIPVDEVLIGNGHTEQQSVCVLIAGQQGIGKTAGEKKVGCPENNQKSNGHVIFLLSEIERNTVIFTYIIIVIYRKQKVNLLNRKIFFIHNNSVNILERK